MYFTRSIDYTLYSFLHIYENNTLPFKNTSKLLARCTKHIYDGNILWFVTLLVEMPRNIMQNVGKIIVQHYFFSVPTKNIYIYIYISEIKIITFRVNLV